MRRLATIFASNPPAEARKPESGAGADISNLERLADCFTASAHFSAHLRAFFSASAGSILTTARAEASGNMPEAPSSTLCRIISSNAADLGRHCATNIFGDGSGGKSLSRTSSAADFWDASAIEHANALPRKSKTSAKSPARARSAPHRWRLSAGPRRTMSPAPTFSPPPKSEKSQYALKPDMRNSLHFARQM